jgi:hypothetical protein
MEQTADYGGTPVFSPAILKNMNLDQAMSFVWRVKSWSLTTSLSWRWLYTMYEYSIENDNWNRIARAYISGADNRTMGNIALGEVRAFPEPFLVFSSEKQLICSSRLWAPPDDGSGDFAGSMGVFQAFQSGDSFSLNVDINLVFGFYDTTGLTIGNSAGSSQDLPSGAIPFFQRVNLSIDWLNNSFSGLIGVQGTPTGIVFPETPETETSVILFVGDGPSVTPGDDFATEIAPTSLEITDSSFVLEAEEYWPYDPLDGGGPIYDATTGVQLRDFPA